MSLEYKDLDEFMNRMDAQVLLQNIIKISPSEILKLLEKCVNPKQTTLRLWLSYREVARLELEKQENADCYPAFTKVNQVVQLGSLLKCLVQKYGNHTEEANQFIRSIGNVTSKLENSIVDLNRQVVSKVTILPE